MQLEMVRRIDPAMDWHVSLHTLGRPRNPLVKALSLNTESNLHELVNMRARWFRKWLTRSKEVAAEEKELKSNMPKHLSKILAQKNLILWKEMLIDSGYPDVNIFDEVSEGTELVGSAATSGVFDKKFRPADMSVHELCTSQNLDNRSLIHSARSSGSEEVDIEVYEKTQEEVRCGWASGPIPEDQLPKNAVISRRFGLKQPNKIRLIDDLSGSNTNATVQADETPRPHSTDVIAAVVLSLISSTSQKFLGRTYDLNAAYKQLGISASSLWASFVVIFNPKTRKPEIYQLLALPFGATKWVYTFLRAAHSLWWLTHKTIDLFFRCLGWDYAVEGDKASSFAEQFIALGVVVDLHSFSNGSVKFSNTAKRTAELCELIDKILSAGSLELKEAQRLRGRMQFADSQLFGRCGRLCLSAVTDHAYKSSSKKLSKACVDALRRCQLSGSTKNLCAVTIEK